MIAIKRNAKHISHVINARYLLAARCDIPVYVTGQILYNRKGIRDVSPISGLDNDNFLMLEKLTYKLPEEFTPRLVRVWFGVPAPIFTGFHFLASSECFPFHGGDGGPNLSDN